MIECSCNVISDRHFKQAVDQKDGDIAAAPSLNKAVGITYHAARALQDEQARPHFRKPCRTCFETVASHIRQAGHFTGETLRPCARYKAGCSPACS